MRVQSIGLNGTLVILSERDLKTLNQRYYTGPRSKLCLLTGGRDAPGCGVIVEPDEEHDQRPIPGRKTTA